MYGFNLNISQCIANANDLCIANFQNFTLKNKVNKIMLK